MNIELFTQDTYNIKEIAELTNISKSRLNLAARRGEIVAVEDKYRARRAKYYTKESILSFIKKMEEQKKVEGISATRLAKEIGVYPGQIYALLEKKEFATVKAPGSSKRTLIPPETEEMIRAHFDSTGPVFSKSSYYNPRYDIVLFQPFKDSKGNIYRVIKSGQQWGFTSPSGKFVEYYTFVSQQTLQPKFAIHKVPTVGKPYTEIELPLTDRHSFQLYDLALSIWGLENLRMHVDEDKILLQLRSGKEHLDAIQSQELSELLPLFLDESLYKLSMNQIEMYPSYKQISVEIPFKKYEQLIKHMEQDDGLTIKQCIDEALELWLNERR